MKVVVATQTDVGLVKIRTGIAGATGGGGGGTANIAVSDTPPANAAANSLWFSSLEGTLKIRYNDGTSNQWVDAFSTPGPQGIPGQNGKVTVANNAPASPAPGELWFHANTGKSYIFYVGPTSNQWVLFADPTTKGDPGANIQSLTYSNSTQTLTIVDSLNNSYSARISYPEFYIAPLSDEVSPINAQVKVATIRAPYNFILTQIPKISLTNAASSGTVTVDINRNGNSILGANKLTIDPGQKTSLTANVQTTLADATVNEDDEFTFDIDNGATGATGLKVTFYYRRA